MSSFSFLGLPRIQNEIHHIKTTNSSSVTLSSMSTVSVVFDMDSLQKAEEKLAALVGKDTSLICCNSLACSYGVLPLLIPKDSLILADELCNLALRRSVEQVGARFALFRHNEMRHLKRLLKDAMNGTRRDANMQPIRIRDARGMPQSKEQALKDYKVPKIFVIVEGVYSMEGDLCSISEILKLKQQFDFELFVDESHSLGILGNQGRGMCQEQNSDTANCDIIMGVFRKPFGLPGGFIAGNKKTIDGLRTLLDAELEEKARKTDRKQKIEPEDPNAALPSPEVLQQLVDRLKFVISQEGTKRREILNASCKHIHRSLEAMGFTLFSSEETPIVTLYVPDIMQGLEFVSAMSSRKFTTKLIDPPRQRPTRVKFCLSAAMTAADLERLLIYCDKFGQQYGLKIHVGAESVVAERDDDDVAIDLEEMRKIELEEIRKVESKRSIKSDSNASCQEVECWVGGKKKKKSGFLKRLGKFLGIRRRE